MVDGILKAAAICFALAFIAANIIAIAAVIWAAIEIWRPDIWLNVGVCLVGILIVDGIILLITAIAACYDDDPP